MNSIGDLVGNQLQSATSTERFSKGRLLTPGEVAIFADGPLRNDERLQGWFMCTTVHPELYKLLREDVQSKNIFMAFEGPQGIPFLVIQHICGGWAHRFIFPVLGDSAWECVEDAKVRGIGISMAEKSDSLAVVSRMYPDGLTELCNLARPSLASVDIARIADHLVTLTMYLLQPVPLVPTDEGINEVCVSALVSNELELEMARTQASLFGKMH